MVRPALQAGPHGFTLIELLVTIAIMVSLLLAAVPLIGDWVYSAQTRDAQAKLMQGFATARALALRDPAKVDFPQAAAGLRLVTSGATTTVLVCTGAPTATDCDLGGAKVYWKTDYPASVSTTLSAGTTLGLDNRGTPLSTTGYTLSRGGSQNDETGFFY